MHSRKLPKSKQAEFACKTAIDVNGSQCGNMQFEIRNANGKDLSAVKKVNNALVHSEGKKGFLMQTRTAEEFRRCLSLCKYFFVAESNNEIAGYLIVLDGSADYSENEICGKFKKFKGFVFAEQMGVLPSLQGNGIGTALYTTLFEKGKKRILLGVFTKPFNEQSRRFHEKLGFRSIGEGIILKSDAEAEIYEFPAR